MKSVVLSWPPLSRSRRASDKEQAEVVRAQAEEEWSSKDAEKQGEIRDLEGRVSEAERARGATEEKLRTVSATAVRIVYLSKGLTVLYTYYGACFTPSAVCAMVEIAFVAPLVCWSVGVVSRPDAPRSASSNASCFAIFYVNRARLVDFPRLLFPKGPSRTFICAFSSWRSFCRGCDTAVCTWLCSFPQLSSEAGLAREKVEQLTEELYDAKDELKRSDSRAKELERRQSEGR